MTSAYESNADASGMGESSQFSLPLEAGTESSDLREWLLRGAEVASGAPSENEMRHRRSFQIASMDLTGRLIVWTVVELTQVPRAARRFCGQD